ncbi:MAG: glycosyltransferase family 4 protein [Candidatus Woesearchaeota archaeon]
MRQLKILEVTHRFPPAVGGCEKVVSELSREMVRQGHDVTVISSTSMKDTDTKGISKGKGITFRSDVSGYKEEDFDGVKLLRFPPDFQFFTFAPNHQMKHFLNKNIGYYDIVHVHGYLSYEAYMVSRLCDDFILTAHDLVSHNPGIFRLMKRIYDLVLGKNILKRASRLIALTPANRDEYTSVCDCGDKIKVIPNGINSYGRISSSERKRLLDSLGNPSKVILFIGRIVEYKGCGDIVKAMPDIIKKHPKSKAVFVGVDGGYTEMLKKMAEERGVRSNCVFTGGVESIEPYLNIADVFVFPSRGEGFGLSPVEAMSMGVPSVMTDIGGLKYVLSWIGGYRLDSAKDIPLQISEKVVRIFSDKRINEKMKAISAKAKEYRWPGIAGKTLELFYDAIDESKSK